MSTAVQVYDLDHNAGLPSWLPPTACDNVAGRVLGEKWYSCVRRPDTLGLSFANCVTVKNPGFTEPQFPPLKMDSILLS